MKSLSAPLCLLALSLCSPASADVAAQYVFGSTDFERKLGCSAEVDDRGNARFQSSNGLSYVLLHDGRFYLVTRMLQGSVVVRMEDVLEAVRTSPSQTVSDERVTEDRWRAVGQTIVEGSRGTAWEYVLTIPSVNVPRYPELVLSDDPRLAPLGAAFAAADATSRFTLSLCNLLGQPYRWADELARMGPLAIGDLTMVKVSYATIDPDRFALPSKPISRAQWLAFARPFPPPPTLADDD